MTSVRRAIAGRSIRPSGRPSIPADTDRPKERGLLAEAKTARPGRKDDPFCDMPMPGRQL